MSVCIGEKCYTVVTKDSIQYYISSYTKDLLKKASHAELRKKATYIAETIMSKTGVEEFFLRKNNALAY